jgi:predicted transposase/invertase (TIGR01784 family)
MKMEKTGMDLPKGSENMGLLPKDADILPATDDRIFRTILTSPEAKPFLMKLIAGLIGRGVVDVTIRGNELGISDTQEKMERFDVNCKTDDGSQVNLEMQASRTEEDSGGEHKNLKARSIYFLCDLHGSQPGKGEKRFDKLARTYQVTFCSYTVFPRRKNYVNSFSMRHDADNELLHDAIQTIIVELSKLDDILKKPVETMADLEKFSVFFEYADNPAYRDTVNKIIESEEVLTVASNLLMNISQDENERAIFLSRKKARMDYASDIATAEDRGRDEGKLECKLEGKLEGKLEERLAIAEKMLRRNRPVDEIVEDTGSTREEVESLKRQLFQ